MPHLSHFTDAPDLASVAFDPGLDRFAIDEEFDDELDLQLAALRESLADFRNA